MAAPLKIEKDRCRLKQSLHVRAALLWGMEYEIKGLQMNSFFKTKDMGSSVSPKLSQVG